jgi:hypothetical protein
MQSDDCHFLVKIIVYVCGEIGPMWGGGGSGETLQPWRARGRVSHIRQFNADMLLDWGNLVPVSKNHPSKLFYA